MNFFYRSNSGSVSVYLILIIVPIFLFHAVLIDYARVKLAERETEAAIKKGVRSAMSEFDLSLQQYGLFALAEDEAHVKDIFTKVSAQNLTSATTQGQFRYLDTHLVNDSVRIKELYTLANHKVFEQQILQEMKYRAPVEFTLELVNKFKKSGIATQLAAVPKLSTNTDNLEKLLDQRDEALDNTWDKEEILLNKSGIIYEKYKERLNDLHILADKVGLNTLDDVKRSVEETKNNIIQFNRDLVFTKNRLQTMSTSIGSILATGQVTYDQIKGLIDQEQALEQNISDINRGLQELANKKIELEQLLVDLIKYLALVQLTRMEIDGDYEQLSQDYDDVDKELKQAQQVNEELRKEKDRLLQNLDNQTPELNGANIFNAIPIYDLQYFSTYRTESGKIIAIFSGFKTRLISTALFVGDAYDDLAAANENLHSQSIDYQSKQGALETQRKEKSDNIKGKKREQKNKMQGALKEAKNVMGGCKITSGDEFDPIYKKLEGDSSKQDMGLYPKYMQYNKADSASGTGQELLKPEDADKTRKSAMKWMEQFTSVLSGIRNEFYVDEYALTKFSYRTIDKQKDRKGNPEVSAELSKPEQHSLKNQEVEYILYGFGSCAGNYTAAYGEMFVMLLAIRTMEALMKPQNELLNLGSPLLVLLAAVTEATMQAVVEMNTLLSGGSVPLIHKIDEIKIDYKEMLRVFLLLHSNDQKMMSRMQALIQTNTGQDLTQAVTYLQGTASSSIRLWFLPAALKGLHSIGISECDISGSRCAITKTAVMSY